MITDIVEVAVHLEELTNLELLRKGVYRVAVFAVAAAHHEDVVGRPFRCYAAPSRLGSLSRGITCEGSDCCSEPGAIGDAAASYTSRCVLLRYSDERFDLNEGCTFQLRIPRHAFLCDPSHSLGQGINLILQLQRADFDAPASSSSSSSRSSPFSAVSSRRVRLTRGVPRHASGAHPPPSSIHGPPPPPIILPLACFLPVLFDTSYLALCTLCVQVFHVGTTYEPGAGAGGSAALLTAPQGFSEGGAAQQQQHFQQQRLLLGGEPSPRGGGQPLPGSGSIGSGPSVATEGLGSSLFRWATGHGARVGAAKLKGLASRLVPPSLRQQQIQHTAAAVESEALADTDGRWSASSSSSSVGNPSHIARLVQHSMHGNYSTQTSRTSTPRLSDALLESDALALHAARYPRSLGELVFPRWHGHQMSLRIHTLRARRSSSVNNSGRGGAGAGDAGSDTAIQHDATAYVAAADPGAPRRDFGVPLNTATAEVAGWSNSVGVGVSNLSAAGAANLTRPSSFAPPSAAPNALPPPSQLQQHRPRRSSQNSEELGGDCAPSTFSSLRPGDQQHPAPFPRLSTEELQSAHAAWIGPLVASQLALQATIRRILREIAAVAAVANSIAPGYESLHSADVFALGLVEGAGYAPSRFHYGVRMEADRQLGALDALRRQSSVADGGLLEGGRVAGEAGGEAAATTAAAARLQLACGDVYDRLGRPASEQQQKSAFNEAAGPLDRDSSKFQHRRIPTAGAGAADVPSQQPLQQTQRRRASVGGPVSYAEPSLSSSGAYSAPDDGISSAAPAAANLASGGGEGAKGHRRRLSQPLPLPSTSALDGYGLLVTPQLLSSPLTQAQLGGASVDGAASDSCSGTAPPTAGRVVTASGVTATTTYATGTGGANPSRPLHPSARTSTSSTSSSGGVGLPFALRVTAAAGDPEAAAAALMHEASHTTSSLHLLWSQLHKLMARYRQAAAGPLQASYRAAAVAAVAAACEVRSLPADCLADPAMAPPPPPPVPPRRVVPGVRPRVPGASQGAAFSAGGGEAGEGGGAAAFSDSEEGEEEGEEEEAGARGAGYDKPTPASGPPGPVLGGGDTGATAPPPPPLLSPPQRSGAVGTRRLGVLGALDLTEPVPRPAPAGAGAPTAPGGGVSAATGLSVAGQSTTPLVLLSTALPADRLPLDRVPLDTVLASISGALEVEISVFADRKLPGEPEDGAGGSRSGDAAPRGVGGLAGQPLHTAYFSPAAVDATPGPAPSTQDPWRVGGREHHIHAPLIDVTGGGDGDDTVGASAPRERAPPLVATLVPDPFTGVATMPAAVASSIEGLAGLVADDGAGAAPFSDRLSEGGPTPIAPLPAAAGLLSSTKPLQEVLSALLPGSETPPLGFDAPSAPFSPSSCAEPLRAELGGGETGAPSPQLPVEVDGALRASSAPPTLAVAHIQQPLAVAHGIPGVVAGAPPSLQLLPGGAGGGSTSGRGDIAPAVPSLAGSGGGALFDSPASPPLLSPPTLLPRVGSQVTNQAIGAHHPPLQPPSSSSSSSATTAAGPAPPAAAAPTCAVLSPSAGSSFAHVAIFLNGLGGSVHDTRLMRSYLKTHHPAVMCYTTASNQQRESEGDLIEAAARIAREIADILGTRLAEDGLSLRHLSIVAFSLGGLVARLALRHPAMRPFRPYLHSLFTVATPHLGLLYSHSTVMAAGLYVLQRWRGSAALAQLSFSDEPTGSEQGLRGCLLYLLACGWAEESEALGGGAEGTSSTPVYQVAAARGAALQAPAVAAIAAGAPWTGPAAAVSSAPPGYNPPRSTGTTPLATIPVPTVSPTLRALWQHGFSGEANGTLLSLFRGRVALFASPQDAYAPLDSCMVQWSRQALTDARHGGAHGEMIRGFWLGVAPQAVVRLAVRFRRYPTPPVPPSAEGPLSAGVGAGGAVVRRIKGAVAGGSGGGAEPGGDGARPASSSFFPSLGLPLMSLDAVIGREAHVAFLESEHLAALLALGPVVRGTWEEPL